MRLTLVAAIACSLVVALPGTASAGWWRMTNPDLVSQTPQGNSGNRSSWQPRLTDDGEIVTFTSDASDLFEGDTTGDGDQDVFYRDMGASACSTVSVPGPDSLNPDRGARDASISDDGRYIAFFSGTDFVPEDTNGGQDLYVYDTETNEFTKASLGFDGASPGSGLWEFRISGDGSHVVFYGDANVLGLDPEGYYADVFVWDRESDETTCASAPNEFTDNVYKGARSGNISDDGRYVAIYTGRRFVESDINGYQDLYMKDLQTGEMTMATMPGPSGARDLQGINVVGDGSGVVFETDSSLVEADMNGRTDIYLWKWETDELVWVTEPNEDSIETDRGSRTPAVSDDGRYIAFVSGVGFVPEDTNAGQDLYVRDMLTGDYSRYLITPDGSPAGNDLGDLDMSGDGTYVAFTWRYSGSGPKMGAAYADPSKTGAAAVDPDSSYDQVYRVRISSDVAPGAQRVFGENRYETAVAVSEDTFDAADTVVIATGANWPDALCASALAGAVAGPVLLTGPDALPADVVAEVERLGAEHAYIVGGYGAVSGDVEEELNDMLPGYVNRLSGADRYATSRAVANRVIDILGGTYSGHSLVTTGDNYPDALSAAPIAAGLDWPILLANPDTDDVYVPMDVMHAAIIGGTGAVSADVEADLADELGADMVHRISGADRYATSANVAQFGVDNGLLWNGVGIASGTGFPDALAGGTAVGLQRSVVLLTPPDALSDFATEKIADNAEDIETVYFFGGSAALNVHVIDQVKAILGWDV